MAGAVGLEPTPQDFGDPNATITPDAYKQDLNFVRKMDLNH